MPRSKSDISNTAIRIFLQEVGRRYDELRDNNPYKGTKAQKSEILEFFGYKCCYCGASIDGNTLNQDHLIPTNRYSLGLHAWGNVVPSCAQCNSRKQQRNWRDYLAELCTPGSDINEERSKRIENFMKVYEYEPNIDLEGIAGNLYQDVGEVAMTLINLRFKQAEDTLKSLHETNDS